MFRSLTTFEDDEEDDDSRNPFFMINSTLCNERPCNDWITAVEDSATNTRKIDVDDEIDNRCTVLWDENNDRWRILLLVED